MAPRQEQVLWQVPARLGTAYEAELAKGERAWLEAVAAA